LPIQKIWEPAPHHYVVALCLVGEKTFFTDWFFLFGLWFHTGDRVIFFVLDPSVGSDFFNEFWFWIRSRNEFRNRLRILLVKIQVSEPTFSLMKFY
jgi:hypothetical protein